MNLQTRRIICLHKEGLTTAQIAARMAMKPETVRARLAANGLMPFEPKKRKSNGNRKGRPFHAKKEQEPLPPLECTSPATYAANVLGAVFDGKRQSYRLQGEYLTTGELIKAANKILHASGQQQLGKNPAWLWP